LIKSGREYDDLHELIVIRFRFLWRFCLYFSVVLFTFFSECDTSGRPCSARAKARSSVITQISFTRSELPPWIFSFLSSLFVTDGFLVCLSSGALGALSFQSRLPFFLEEILCPGRACSCLWLRAWVWHQLISLAQWIWVKPSLSTLWREEHCLVLPCC
jgi:hypothetical protein